MPKSLLVIGSGAIGIEFASFYRSLGAEVTVVEILHRILPVEDEEISAFATSVREAGHEDPHRHDGEDAEKNGGSVTATLEGNGKSWEITADRVILAVGIVGNVEDLGIDGTRVKVEKAHIVIDEYCRTGRARRLRDRRRGGPAVAGAQGEPRGRRVASRRSPASTTCTRSMSRAIPGCTYCWPQVASVGLTEQAAKEKGIEVKVGHFPFIGNGKAIALGEPEGMVKTVFDARAANCSART